MSSGEKNKQKGKGARHKDPLYDNARLEVAVLDFLDGRTTPGASGTCTPVAVTTLADVFDMTVEEMTKMLDELRKAQVVLFNKISGTAALLPLPAQNEREKEKQLCLSNLYA